MNARQRRAKPLTSYGPKGLLRLLDRPGEYAGLSDADLDEFVYFAISVYGMTGRTELIPKLMALYEVFQRWLSPEQRRQNYAAVVSRVVSSEASLNALLPYLFMDEDIGVVSTAALDYAQVFPLRDGDPLSGPKDVVQHVGRGALRNPVAALGGLVTLGDQRVLDFLGPVRDRLSPQQVKILTQCSSGFLSHATVQFYLRWLEGLDGGVDDGIFGSVAGYLYRAPQQAFAREVRDVRRIVPATPEAAIEVLGRWSIAEYAALLRPRFEAILEREGGTKVMPHVMQAWGIPVEERPGPEGCPSGRASRGPALPACPARSNRTPRGRRSDPELLKLTERR
jgi:hypothetical protein